jgi:hypothetical protein
MITVRDALMRARAPFACTMCALAHVEPERSIAAVPVGRNGEVCSKTVRAW